MIHVSRIKNRWLLLVSILAFPVAYFVPLSFAISFVSLLSGIIGWMIAALFAKKPPEVPYRPLAFAFLLLGLIWNFTLDNPMGFNHGNTWIMMPVGPLMLAYFGGWIADKICSNNEIYL